MAANIRFNYLYRTLFEPNKTTNIIYKIEDKNGNSVLDEHFEQVNSVHVRHNYTLWIKKLSELGYTITFYSYENENFKLNLQLIDSDLPKILAWALFYRWIKEEASLKKVSEILEQEDPLNFYNGAKSLQKLYEYKIKRFLTEYAMGMTSETPWIGEYDSIDGVIIAKEDGEIRFNRYDLNLLKSYLLENTMFEQAATDEDGNNPSHIKLDAKKKYYYEWLFEENERLFFKINLQIRFF